VGRDGRLLADTVPQAVTREVLEAALENKSLASPDITGEQSLGPTVFQAWIRKTLTPDAAAFQSSKSKLRFVNQPLEWLLAGLYGIPATRIDV
jgi:hypothetical protein